MIPRPRLRPQSLFQAWPSVSRFSSQNIQSRWQSNGGHAVPPLLGSKDEVFAKYGVPGFLSAQTYNSAWLQYQKHLCDYINSQVAGTTYERVPIRDLHELLSRRPTDASLYNYAAQAHHNHFFWNTLSTSPDPISPAAHLSADISEWFESPSHLRDEMTDAALSMFGQGYVWLMREMSSTKRLWILCTYNAGSPFPDAHRRRQTRDVAARSELGQRLTNPQNTVGAFGDTSKAEATYHQHALLAMPILCLKMWEHQWLPDYGVLGKEMYVKQWWNRIDWDQVQNLYNLVPEYPSTDRQRSAAAIRNNATPEGQNLLNVMSGGRPYS